MHAGDAFRIALQRLERRNAHHRNVVAGEAVALEQLAHLELDQIHQLRIVNRVDLVERDDQVRHVDLLGEQHVLAGLRHRAVDRADDQDAAVHLRRAGDHVLDVVGVTRAVHVRVVTVRRAVLDVARRDRQDLGRVATSLRLGSLGHFVVRDELRPALVRGDLGQRSGQRGLAVVDVPDGANVDVRFGSIEFLFCHVVYPVPRLRSSTERLSTASPDKTLRLGPAGLAQDTRPSVTRPATSEPHSGESSGADDRD